MGIDWTERIEPVPGAVMGDMRMIMMIPMMMMMVKMTMKEMMIYKIIAAPQMLEWQKSYC